jgi:hypothetical protein
LGPMEWKRVRGGGPSPSLDQWFAVCQYGFSLIVGACAMDDTDIVLTRHRLNVDDYHRMGEAGILTRMTAWN